VGKTRVGEKTKEKPTPVPGADRPRVACAGEKRKISPLSRKEGSRGGSAASVKGGERVEGGRGRRLGTSFPDVGKDKGNFSLGGGGERPRMKERETSAQRGKSGEA